MSIIVDKNTKILVQGLTGKSGTFHTNEALSYYHTQMVAGIHPEKGGSFWKADNGKILPIFGSVLEGKEKTGANASIIYVPPISAASAILEAIKAEIEIIVCITEGIPTLDMVKIKDFLINSKSYLIGPNCPGILTVEECKMGIMPGSVFKKGSVGIVSRSGTLTYEAVLQTSISGLGQTTAIGIGGDPVKGLGFIDILQMFLSDNKTKSIIMIGEIGGSEEEEAAIFLKDEWKKKHRKPIVGFIAGHTAPYGRTMGHAGAIISSGKGDAESKTFSLREAGVKIATSPSKLSETLIEAIKLL